MFSLQQPRHISTLPKLVRFKTSKCLPVCRKADLRPAALGSAARQSRARANTERDGTIPKLRYVGNIRQHPRLWLQRGVGRRAQSLYCYCAVPRAGRPHLTEACLRSGAIKGLRPTAPGNVPEHGYKERLTRPIGNAKGAGTANRAGRHLRLPHRLIVRSTPLVRSTPRV
jgi:hypothetical protein